MKKLVPGCESVLAASSGAVADIKVKPGDNVRFGEQQLEVRATPGHTAGAEEFFNILYFFT